MVRDHGKTTTAWRRESAIFLNELGQPETKTGDGKDVTLTVEGRVPFAAWIKDSQLILFLWHDGKQNVIAQEAAFPNLSTLPNRDVLLAWEAKNGVSIRRIRR